MDCIFIFIFNMVPIFTVLSASDLVYDCPDWKSWGDVPTLFLRHHPLTTLGRPTLPLSWICSGVSRVRKPLSLTHALLGQVSPWPVVLLRMGNREYSLS